MSKEKFFPNLENKLQLWIKNGWNVLFSGKAGVGKTAIIKQAFEKAKLRYKIFSGATLDPWVDFIGIPKEIKNEGISYLDIIPPKDLATDSIDVIFIDEFNRSKAKIRNAAMELIQFKSINGRKFNSLKMVWAAINPDDDEDHSYDVEALDPAQKDRFHIHVKLPYLLSKEYFTNKYKDESLIDTCVEWWDSLSTKAKNDVSPRRLDYAIEVFLGYGDIEDVLPESSNPSELKKKLKETPVMKKLKNIFDSKNDNMAREFLQDESNYIYSISTILNNKLFFQYFIPLLEKEKISSLMSENDEVQEFVLNKYQEIKTFNGLLEDIVSTNTNKMLVGKIIDKFEKNELKKEMVYFFENINGFSKNKNVYQGNSLPYEFSEVANNDSLLSYICFIKNNYKISDSDVVNIKDNFEANKIFDNLSSRIPKDISSECILGIFDILTCLINLVGERVAKRWENIMPLINVCINVLIENKYDFKYFYKNYLSLSNFIFLNKKNFLLLL